MIREYLNLNLKLPSRLSARHRMKPVPTVCNWINSILRQKCRRNRLTI